MLQFAVTNAMLCSLIAFLATQESDMLSALAELVELKPAFAVEGNLGKMEDGKPKIEKGPVEYYDEEGNKVASFFFADKYRPIWLNWDASMAKTAFAEKEGTTLLIADEQSVKVKHFAYPVATEWMGQSILLTSKDSSHFCSILKQDPKTREWAETPIAVKELSQTWVDSESSFWAMEKESASLIHVGKDGTVDRRHAFTGDYYSMPAPGFNLFFSSHLATDIIAYDADSNEEKTILERPKSKETSDYHFQWVPGAAVLAVCFREKGNPQFLKTYDPIKEKWEEFSLPIVAFGEMVPISDSEVAVQGRPKNELTTETYFYKINVKTGVATAMANKAPVGILRRLHACCSNVDYEESGVYASVYPTGKTPSLVESMTKVLELKPDLVMQTFSPGVSKAEDFDWPTSYTYYSASGQRLATIELPKKCGGIHLSTDKKTAVSWIYSDNRTYVTILKDNDEDRYKELPLGTSLEWFGDRLLATTRGMSLIEEDAKTHEWLLRSISKYQFTSYCQDSQGGLWAFPNAITRPNRYALFHLGEEAVVDVTLETGQSFVPQMAVDDESHFVFLSNHNNLVVVDTRQKTETTLIEPTKDSILSQIVKFVWMPKIKGLAIIQNGEVSVYYPETKKRAPVSIGRYAIGSIIPLNDKELLMAARPADSGKTKLYRLNVLTGEINPFDKDVPTNVSVRLERLGGP